MRSTIIEDEFVMEPVGATGTPKTPQKNESKFKYMVLGIFFGVLLVKAEIASWYRIQEMFLLHSFYMYQVMGTAVGIGIASVLLIKKFDIKTIAGDSIIFVDKPFHWGQVIGGLIFGFGWAITGACPGPLFAQIGAGFYAISITLLSAVAGTWLYGLLREKLPH